MKKLYTLTTEQHRKILEASNPFMVYIGSKREFSGQDNLKRTWERIGKEMGFDWLTIEPGENQFEFMANPISERGDDGK